MRRALLPLLALAAPAAALAQTRPEIVRFRVAEADTSWQTETRCTAALADGTRACRCFVPSPADDPGAEGAPLDSVRLWIERGGATVARWAEPGRAFQSFGFDLARLDLDGDGAPEHVLAHHESEGNGLGARQWQILVVDGRRPAEAPLAFTSDEHGDDAFVPTPRGWRLLAGAWEDGYDPRRGHGLYFTGRLYRYDGRTGTLAPDAAEPVRRRRYLNSFQAERGRTLDAETTRGLPGQTPWRWLQSAAAQRLRADPGVPARRSRTTDVRFFGAAEQGGLRGYAVQEPGEPTLAFLGPRLQDGATGRLYPEGYAPRGGWPAAGLAARLVAFAPPPGSDTGGEPVYVVRLGR